MKDNTENKNELNELFENAKEYAMINGKKALDFVGKEAAALGVDVLEEIVGEFGSKEEDEKAEKGE